MDKIPIIVVGAGHLGRYHIQKLQSDPGCHLLGAVEVDAERSEKIGRDFGIQCHPRIELFVPDAKAAIIATPTSTHREVAIRALSLGMDVLIEKPIAPTHEEAQAIIDCAKLHNKIIQVGHTERFNPAVAAALPLCKKPRYISAERLAPFTGRSTDTDVVLDLLIHDLDIVAALISSPVQEVRAIGVPILTNAIDMCSARIQFADGSVAELKAGRASLEASRKIRLFSEERYISIDCGQKEVKSVRRLAPQNGSPWPQIQAEPVDVSVTDALQLQDAHFVECVRSRRTPKVCGQAGLKALKLAEAVLEAMACPNQG